MWYFSSKDCNVIHTKFAAICIFNKNKWTSQFDDISVSKYIIFT